MKHHGIPTCYFPTTAVFVDDSKDFLMNLSLQFDDYLAYRLYESPQEALTALVDEKGYQKRLNARCFSEYTEAIVCPISNRTINVDFDEIHREVYNPSRFNEVSVLFVDYSMPGMNGLELCKALENSPMKKVLLTGQADEKMAVQAFNEGIIDNFILKNDPDVINVMNNTIRDLQQRYFQEISEMTVQALAVDSPTFLKDPLCAKFFKQFCQQHGIVEFYLTESTGSFLLLDIDGTPSVLIIKTTDDMQMLCEIATDNHVAPAILKKLEQGTGLPYSPQSQGYSVLENIDWENHMVDALKLEAQDTYYYAWIENPDLSEFDFAKITPYSAYLDSQD